MVVSVPHMISTLVLVEDSEYCCNYSTVLDEWDTALIGLN